MAGFPHNNRTFQILKAAREGGYAVGAYNCYNEDGVIAVIRAAEACRSPALIQLFPWTLKYHGAEFVRYVVRAAHAATVPIAVHLDHCIEPEDVEAALELPFDSIMIDASTHDPEANIKECKRVVDIANSRGIAIEAEMGRINGGEDGLPTVDMEAVLTQPESVKEFVEQTGVQFLAPAFGNIHGKYGPKGIEGSWRLPLLMEIHNAIPDIPLVLHGTTGLTEEFTKAARKHGMVKINLNHVVRDAHMEFVTENIGKLEFTVMKELALEIYVSSIVKVMEEFVESAGKA